MATKGYKRFALAMTALVITGYTYLATGAVEPLFGGITILAFDWFFKAHSSNGGTGAIV